MRACGGIFDTQIHVAYVGCAFRIAGAQIVGSFFAYGQHFFYVGEYVPPGREIYAPFFFEYVETVCAAYYRYVLQFVYVFFGYRKSKRRVVKPVRIHHVCLGKKVAVGLYHHVQKVGPVQPSYGVFPLAQSARRVVVYERERP